MDLFQQMGTNFNPNLKEISIYSDVKKITIIDAVSKAFNRMPDKFYASSLIVQVRDISGRPNVFDGTVLRKLRELRADQESNVNYRVINNKQAYYEKRM